MRPKRLPPRSPARPTSWAARPTWLSGTEGAARTMPSPRPAHQASGATSPTQVPCRTMALASGVLQSHGHARGPGRARAAARRLERGRGAGRSAALDDGDRDGRWPTRLTGTMPPFRRAASRPALRRRLQLVGATRRPRSDGARADAARCRAYLDAAGGARDRCARDGLQLGVLVAELGGAERRGAALRRPARPRSSSSSAPRKRAPTSPTRARTGWRCGEPRPARSDVCFVSTRWSGRGRRQALRPAHRLGGAARATRCSSTVPTPDYTGADLAERRATRSSAGCTPRPRAATGTCARKSSCRRVSPAISGWKEITSSVALARPRRDGRRPRRAPRRRRRGPRPTARG